MNIQQPYLHSIASAMNIRYKTKSITQVKLIRFNY